MTEAIANGTRATKKALKSQDEAVLIPQIQPKVLQVEIVGITPLITCQWSVKADREILDKQMKKAKQPKSAKDPHADYMAARYISTEGWDGIPAGGVKGCLVNACRAVGKELPMTLAKRVLFVAAQGVTPEGQELVRIYGEPKMRKDHVKINNGTTADIRFRPEYTNWSAILEIHFLANIFSAEQVLNLLELAGYVEGLCEWRPGAPKNCTGSMGRFKIKRGEE